jgi:hypothetical protein
MMVAIPGHVLNNKKTKIGIDGNELKDRIVILVVWMDVNVCMYVCFYVCMYICMNVYAYVHIYDIRVSVCTVTNMFLCI